MSDLEKLDRGGAGVFAPTLDSQRALVDPRVTYSYGAYNMSAGVYEGMGPRYGFSIIPGQSDNETISGTRFPGLRASEGAPAQGCVARRKFLGILAMKTPGATLASPIDGYWVIFTIIDTVEYLCIQPLSTLVTLRAIPSANIFDGLDRSYQLRSTALTGSNFLKNLVISADFTKATAKANSLLFASTKNYVASAVFTCSGRDVPMQWMFGRATATGGLTTAPSVCFRGANTVTDPNTGSPHLLNGGIPTEYQLGNFKTAQRSVKVTALTVLGDLNILYSATFFPTTTIMVPNQYESTSVASLDLSTVTAAKNTAGTTYANTIAALVNDPSGVTRTGYRAILVAAEKSHAVLMQDAYRTETAGGGMPTQLIELTQNSWQPPSVSSVYTEAGITKKTCFAFWPEFVRGTAMVTGAAGTDGFGPGLGTVNTGILRANTVYEFTYSFYNKSLDAETNVGVPVKIQTSAVDFVALQLFAKGASQSTMFAAWNAFTEHVVPYPFSNFVETAIGSYAGPGLSINHIEYRFYYRQEGTFEWLPALTVDASRLWFSTEWVKLYACAGPMAGLPGGQPGAFNDYSLLPTDKYTCVLTYKDRAWWFSESNIYFSLRYNIFAYPGRNAIASSSGAFLGGTVHNYPGEAEQGSRLIIWSSTGVFIARFTGVRAQMPVQVSPVSTFAFDVDGSDLVVEPWTSNTAFSYRAAVVADGILFWWGPDGIIQDGGVATPQKISPDLEPEIFQIYDPSKTDEIFAHYNSHTKEIIWFYPPKVADSTYPTYGLAYHVEKQIFYPMKFGGKIDNVSMVDVTTSGAGTAGKRAVASVRETAATTTQRGYFFDYRNRSGDMKPKTELVVKTIATNGIYRRLTLATGFDATNVATIVAGDYIAMQQAYQYNSSLSPTVTPFIAAVAAVDSVGGTIDLVLPDGTVLNNDTPTFDRYMPVWHVAKNGAGLNGIAFSSQSNYWVPFGAFYAAQWLFFFFIFRFVAWKQTRAPRLALAWRTPVSTEEGTGVLTLEDNSDGYCQRLFNADLGEVSSEGQGVKIRLAGYHVGPEWVLESLTTLSNPRDANHLKDFQES
jgi:hypothetical protein